MNYIYFLHCILIIMSLLTLSILSCLLMLSIGLYREPVCADISSSHLFLCLLRLRLFCLGIHSVTLMLHLSWLYLFTCPAHIICVPYTCNPFVNYSLICEPLVFVYFFSFQKNNFLSQLSPYNCDE